MRLDKWQIGPLRVLNLLAFMIVFTGCGNMCCAAVAVEPFFTLGKASLHVYCAHLFFVFAGLALLYGEVEQLHGVMAISLVAVTFAVLILVALNEARKRRRNREAKLRQQAMQVPSPPEKPPSLLFLLRCPALLDPSWFIVCRERPSASAPPEPAP